MLGGDRQDAGNDLLGAQPCIFDKSHLVTALIACVETAANPAVRLMMGWSRLLISCATPPALPDRHLLLLNLPLTQKRLPRYIAENSRDARNSVRCCRKRGSAEGKMPEALRWFAEPQHNGTKGTPFVQGFLQAVRLS